MDSEKKPRYYKIIDAQKNGAVRLKSIQPYDEMALKSGDVTILHSFPVRIDEGKKFYDILWLQDVFNFSVSDRIHTALTEAGITGWRSYPLLIEGRDEKYWGIQVSGRAGPPFRPAESGFVIGLNFDHSTWDGSDMFILDSTMITLFSERLRDLLIKLKASNLQLDETSTKEWYSSRAT
jgi:hypothetical protein